MRAATLVATEKVLIHRAGLQPALRIRPSFRLDYNIGLYPAACSSFLSRILALDDHGA